MVPPWYVSFCRIMCQCTGIVDEKNLVAGVAVPFDVSSTATRVTVPQPRGSVLRVDGAASTPEKSAKNATADSIEKRVAVNRAHKQMRVLYHRWTISGESDKDPGLHYDYIKRASCGLVAVHTWR